MSLPIGSSRWLVWVSDNQLDHADLDAVGVVNHPVQVEGAQPGDPHLGVGGDLGADPRVTADRHRAEARSGVTQGEGAVGVLGRVGVGLDEGD